MASYRKLSTGWEYRVSYKGTDGKYHRKVGKGFKTKAEAQQVAGRIELERDHPEIIASTITLVDYLEQWAEIYRRPIITEVTWRKYVEAINRAKLYFGDLTLAKITPTKYQLVLNELGNNYSQNTLNNFHYPIKNAVKAAIREHIIDEDFTDGAIVKSLKSGKPVEEKFLQADEYSHVLEVTRKRFETESYFFIYLLAVTGLRFAEAQGLTWNDIDFVSGLISVDKTWNNTLLHDFAPTKNKSSIRKVPVSNKILKALKEYKEEFWNKNEYNRILSNISNNSVNKALKLIVGRNVSAHSLRHTYASFLITKGVDLITISQLLGHENLNITLKVYA
jgi:integrase